MAADGTVKLSDFGLGSLAEAGTGPDGLLRTVCGTPNYAAPEVLLEQPYDGAAADLWSLGVCNSNRPCCAQWSANLVTTCIAEPLLICLR